MTTNGSHAQPTRSERHDALDVFVGRWRAEGKVYSVPDNPGDDPRSKAAPWTSSHAAKWHSERFLLVQDEKAITGGHNREMQ
jgi:hypothetical protein